MKRFLMILGFGFLLCLPVWSQNEEMTLIVLRTGTASPLEGATIQGGSWFKKFPMVHPVFLVKHPKGTILFDTGLGRTAQKQVQDMPWWARLATTFFQEEPAADQLQKMNIKPDRIILSHVHFDHVSGLPDFPNVPVEILPEELEFTKTKGVSAAVFPELFPDTIPWKVYELENKVYEGYAKSRDIFGDGRLILVGLPGHTPGSVGLFVNISDKKRVFLVGDTVWNGEALEKGLPKFWITRQFADNKPDEVLKRIKELQELRKRRPDLFIVPSHDAAVVDALVKFVSAE